MNAPTDKFGYQKDSRYSDSGQNSGKYRRLPRDEKDCDQKCARQGSYLGEQVKPTAGLFRSAALFEI